MSRKVLKKAKMNDFQNFMPFLSTKFDIFSIYAIMAPDKQDTPQTRRGGQWVGRIAKLKSPPARYK